MIVDAKVGYDNLLTVSSFLSQIFKPSNKGIVKPMPAKMLEVILKHCRKELDPEEFKIFVKEFLDSLDQWKLTFPLKNQKQDEIWKNWLELIASARGGSIHIFCPDTMLFEWKTNESALEFFSKISDIIIEHVKAHGGQNYEHLKTPFQRIQLSNRFRIYMPEIPMIVSFWQSLNNFFVEFLDMEQSQVSNVLKLAGEDFLVTSTINIKYCVVPMIYLSTAIVNGSAVSGDHKFLYSFSFISNNDGSHVNLNMIEYSRATISLWNDSHFIPMTVDPESYGIKRIKFQMVESLIGG